MTIPQPVAAAPQVQPLLPMPDPPERRPEERSGFNHLNLTGSTYLLTKYFGHPNTTLVAGEHYIASFPTRTEAAEWRVLEVEKRARGKRAPAN